MLRTILVIIFRNQTMTWMSLIASKSQMSAARRSLNYERQRRTALQVTMTWMSLIASKSQMSAGRRSLNYERQRRTALQVKRVSGVPISHLESHAV